MKRNCLRGLFVLLCVASSFGAETKMLTNHLGYEPTGPKHAVILGKAGDNFSKCSLKADATDQPVLSVEVKSDGETGISGRLTSTHLRKKGSIIWSAIRRPERFGRFPLSCRAICSS